MATIEELAAPSAACNTQRQSILERRLAAAKRRLVDPDISPAQRRRAEKEFARLCRLRLDGPAGRERHERVIRSACHLPTARMTAGDRARLAAVGIVVEVTP